MINRGLTLVMDEQIAEGTADPLAESFTLGAIWESLWRHAGEEVMGGRLNRVVNTTLLVPGRSTFDLPVSCVEHGC